MNRIATAIVSVVGLAYWGTSEAYADNVSGTVTQITHWNESNTSWGTVTVLTPSGTYALVSLLKTQISEGRAQRMLTSCTSRPTSAYFSFVTQSSVFNSLYYAGTSTQLFVYY